MSNISEIAYRVFFPKKYTYKKELEECLNKANGELNRLNLVIEEQTKIIEQIQQLTKTFNLLDVIYPTSENNTIKVILQGNDGSLFLYDAYCSLNNYLCSILITKYDDTIHIDDIPNGTQVNKGYGSLLMDYLFEYAKKNNIKKIKGSLSIVDIKHRNRALHFYDKHGFNIKGNQLIKLL